MEHPSPVDQPDLDAPWPAIPETFARHVREALLCLYDPVGLQHSALLTLAGPVVVGATPGQWLRGQLLDAIEALHPAAGVTSNARVWRTYRLLESRYIEGHDVGSVAEQVALSKSQYHRENQHALRAVASVLWERWRVAERWPTGAVGAGDQARQEAAGLVPGGLVPVDLVGVLGGVRDLLEPLCARHGVILDLVVPASVPPVLGERVAVRQALLALLAPIISAGSDRRLSIEMVDRTPYVEARVEGRIAAPGPSIRQSLREAQPFVAALGGALAHHPSAGPGQSWAICLTLPASDRPTLLVVDNNADFIRLVERYLAGHGWEVVGAPDVERAEAETQRRPPRAILLDVVMPGRDGWELLLALKRRPGTRLVPVIVCSVLSEPAVALSLGAAAYLHKPVSRQQLANALAAHR